MTAAAFTPSRTPSPVAPSRRLSPLTGLANTFTLTWRSLLKLKTNPEDLAGLTLTPILYLVMFTYLFGGAISGNVHNYL
jgi:oleandomycin transport system permease protein